MKKHGFLALLLIVLPVSANAAGFTDNLTGSVVFTNQYVFRGLAQSDEHMAVQGSIDYAHDSGLYAGVWGSNVDFNDSDEASVEIDLYGGWGGEFHGFSLDAGLIYYTYPGADDSRDYDYYEVAGSVGYDFDVLAVTGAINYSPDFFAGSDDAWYFSGNADVPLPYDLTFSAHYGYQTIEDETSFGSPDYSDWSFGLGYSYNNIDFSVNYIDTDLNDGVDCVSGWCDERVVGALTFNLN